MCQNRDEGWFIWMLLEICAMPAVHIDRKGISDGSVKHEKSLPLRNLWAGFYAFIAATRLS